MTFKQYFAPVAIFLCLVGLGALIYALSVQNVTEYHKRKNTTKKNVILIVADDLGWSDVGYDSGQGTTPTLNRLAMEGIILNQTYTYPMCTPSRTAILTGVFTERTGLQHFVIPNSVSFQPIGIPTNFHLMPQYLNRYGYKSHIVGKWHVGSCKMEQTPIMRGFETFYGFFYGVQDYYSHKTKYLDVGDFTDFWLQTKNQLKPITDKSDIYSTFLYNNRIQQIIDSHNKSEPLFLYYAAQNPHSDANYNVPKEYEDKFSKIQDPFRRRILAMINLLDESILNITRDLERNEMLDNTIILFTSDNGGEIGDYQRNYPLRGGKTTVFEGGQRVRAFISGRNLGVEPYAYEGMFHSVDWIPTILSAALGQPTEIEGIDGVNQWEAIKSNGPSKRDSFIYTIDSSGCRKNAKELCETSTEAIRVQDWKLIRGCPGLWTSWYNMTSFNLPQEVLDKGVELSISGENSQTCLDPENKSPKRYFLFNIKNDPLEKSNLAAQMPCKIRELEKKLEEYHKITVEPQLIEPLPMYNDLRADPRNFGNMFWPGWC